MTLTAESVANTATDEPPDAIAHLQGCLPLPGSQGLNFTRKSDAVLHKFDKPLDSTYLLTSPMLSHPPSPAFDGVMPKLGYSPGHTESLSGSPSSVTSAISCASLRRGDTADTEDEPEMELEAVDEAEELDLNNHTLSSLNLDDKRVPTSVTESMDMYPVPPNPVSVRSKKEDEKAALSSRESIQLRKGRVFELAANANEISRPAVDHDSPVTSSHEWEGEIMEPPPPQPNLHPHETVPAIPSPLCVSYEPGENPSKSDSRRVLGVSDSEHRNDAGRRESTPARRRSRRLSRGRQPLKSALSSSEDEKQGESRKKNGKKHSVRFCNGPPEERRTHSPVDYDRKAHPVHSRLCSEDLRELRDLNMPIDLLQSRCQCTGEPDQQSMASPKDNTLSSLPKYDLWHTAAMQGRSASTEPTPPACPTASNAWEYMDEAAKCNEATSFRQKDATQRTSRSLDQHDPLDDLNAMHRERARTPSFYGTSAHPSSAAGSTLASSIAARFGLYKPPPPLPGMERSVPALSEASKSTSNLVPRVSARSVSAQSTPQKRQSRSLSPHTDTKCPIGELGSYGSEYDMMNI